MKPSDCNNRNRKLIKFKKDITELDLTTFLAKLSLTDEIKTDSVNLELNNMIEELERIGLKAKSIFSISCEFCKKSHVCKKHETVHLCEHCNNTFHTLLCGGEKGHRIDCSGEPKID